MPPPVPGAMAALAGVVLAELLGRLAGGMQGRGTPVGYTRKLVHFGVFTVAAVVHLAGALPLTNAFGAGVATRVLVSVRAGRADPLYRAFARPADAPREALFIVVPLVTTAVGGVATALLTGPFAPVGYMVAGWGDAAGEPVGERWGRHPYPVPSLGGVTAHRTLEGSGAVLVAGVLAAVVTLALLAPPVGPAALGGAALSAGAAGALAEAVSPHGTDNLTVPLAAALTVHAILG